MKFTKRQYFRLAGTLGCWATLLILGAVLIQPDTALAQGRGVRVVFERILMIDDSDDLSDGDMCVVLWVNPGKPGGRGIVIQRTMGSGNTYPLNQTVQLDNPPDDLVLSAQGTDSDVSILGCPSPPELPRHSVESNSKFDTNYADYKTNLEQFPGTSVRKSFSMRSKPSGRLRFTVYGRIEIARTPTPTLAYTGKTVNRVLDDTGVLTTLPAPRKSIGKKGFYGTFMTTTSNGGDFEMKLAWDGNDRVTGTFSGNGSTGTIAGTLFGNVLIFKWSQDGGKYNGSGKFVMSDDGKTFTGSYSNSMKNPEDGSAGAWNGRRL